MEFYRFPHQWLSSRSWMCFSQKHKCRHTQQAPWSWPVTTGCPHIDQSQGRPSRHVLSCRKMEAYSSSQHWVGVKERHEQVASYAERRLSLVSFRAKMWTVPLSLEAHRKDESWLKLMLEKRNKHEGGFSRWKLGAFKSCVGLMFHTL